MKRLKIAFASTAVILAIGGSLALTANQGLELPDSNSTNVTPSVVQIGYVREVPNDPNSCKEIGEVNCNPLPITNACTVLIGSTNEFVYDSNCNLLYKDQNN